MDANVSRVEMCSMYEGGWKSTLVLQSGDGAREQACMPRADETRRQVNRTEANHSVARSQLVKRKRKGRGRGREGGRGGEADSNHSAQGFTDAPSDGRTKDDNQIHAGNEQVSVPLVLS